MKSPTGKLAPCLIADMDREWRGGRVEEIAPRGHQAASRNGDEGLHLSRGLVAKSATQSCIKLRLSAASADRDPLRHLENRDSIMRGCVGERFGFILA
jgi:hypothetical protein